MKALEKISIEELNEVLNNSKGKIIGLTFIPGDLTAVPDEFVIKNLPKEKGFYVLGDSSISINRGLLNSRSISVIYGVYK